MSRNESGCRAIPNSEPVIRPFMQPTLTPDVPEGADWIHEIKCDVYRTQLVIDHGEVRAFTRNCHGWTARHPGVVEAARSLPCQSAIIDGEMIVQDEQAGRTCTLSRRRCDTIPSASS